MNQTNKGFNLILATAIISGFSIFINKYGVKGIDPYFYTFVKNLLAGGVLAGIILLSGSWRQLLKLDRADKLRLIAIGLFGGAIAFLLYFKGLSMTAAFKAGFIHKTMFLYAGVLAAIFLKEKISKSMLIGCGGLLAGSFFFLKVQPQSLNQGDLLVLAAVVLWAAELVLAKTALKKISGTVVAGVRLLLGSFFILVFLLTTGRVGLLGSPDAGLLVWVLISGLLLAAYNWTFYNGLKAVKVAEASAILTLAVPITGILTLVFSDQAWGSSELIGALLILSGVMLIADVTRLAFGKRLRLIFRSAAE